MRSNWLVAMALFAGCGGSGAQGDPCELDDNCEQGLRCNLDDGDGFCDVYEIEDDDDDGSAGCRRASSGCGR